MAVKIAKPLKKKSDHIYIDKQRSDLYKLKEMLISDGRKRTGREKAGRPFRFISVS